jgi:apolipoprotein N-acyltransferase
LKAQQNKPSFSKYAKYSAFAFQFVAIFVALSLGGNWLDERMGYEFPIYTLVGVFVSLIAIFYSLYTFINKESNDQE